MARHWRDVDQDAFALWWQRLCGSASAEEAKARLAEIDFDAGPAESLCWKDHARAMERYLAGLAEQRAALAPDEAPAAFRHGWDFRARYQKRTLTNLESSQPLFQAAGGMRTGLTYACQRTRGRAIGMKFGVVWYFEDEAGEVRFPMLVPDAGIVRGALYDPPFVQLHRLLMGSGEPFQLTDAVGGIIADCMLVEFREETAVVG